MNTGQSHAPKNDPSAPSSDRLPKQSADAGRPPGQDFELDVVRLGTSFTITLRVGAEVIHMDHFNPATATRRAKFANEAHAKRPDLSAEGIEVKLLKLVADAARASASGAPQPSSAVEVDAGQEVRPELFHTKAVSGLTITTRRDEGGQIVPRRRTYLRWADERRQEIDTPKRLDLPDGSSLFLSRNSSMENGSAPPEWSSQARREWLAGAVAPDAAGVFARVRERVADFLDFPPETADGTTATVALWVVFSYVFRAWDAVPYLYVGGPMGSGKSRLLDVIARMAFRPLISCNLTGPALFRTLDDRGGTLIYDEAEQLRLHAPEVGELNSILLSGYKRTGRATRLEPADEGYRSVSFDVFGPKAVACIGGLPPTLASRCIPIIMSRSPRDSDKSSRRLGADPEVWQLIRDDLHALTLENGPTWVELPNRSGVVPAGISNRDYELWQPLLALAGWFQDRGADGLLDTLQAHAVQSVAAARDDAVPEADEILLEILADAIRAGRLPTPGELLAAAKKRDEVTFKGWYPNRGTQRLLNYGIPRARKVNGERRHRDVTPDTLRRIEERYGIDLGFAAADETGDGPA